MNCNSQFTIRNQKPLKILIVSGIFPPDIGGPATYVPALADALAARGDRITVVTMSDAPSAGDVYPYPVQRVDRRRGKPARWLAAFSTILRAGRDAELLYAVGLLPQTAAAASRLRRPLAARIVSDLAWDRATGYGWTTDTLEAFQQRRYGARIELLRGVQRWAMRRARRSIVPSEWLASWVRRSGVPADRVRVVPNALPPLPEVSPRRIEVSTPHLVAVSGRLVPVKRVDLVIRALRDVPETSLLVIGDGPERASLQRLVAELGLAARVIFAGRQGRGDLLAYLAGCDALVQCSAHEGFPYTVLEAMRLGVPVIATPVGGVVEIISDGTNGLLVEGTSASLAHGLRRLLGDAGLRAALAARAFEDAAARSFDAMVDATRAVLAEAVR